jgi:hypothetical protein
VPRKVPFGDIAENVGLCCLECDPGVFALNRVVALPCQFCGELRRRIRE